MHIGFDISQTGSGKAGCGFFADAMIRALQQISDDRFTLFPSFGDFYLDPGMPEVNPYQPERASYGPRHAERQSAGAFWSAPELDDAIGNPDIVHANNFWCPTQLRRAKLVYTLYDLHFAAHPQWTTETNRIGCFDGVFRASAAADWVVAISEASRHHFLQIFPQFPEDRVRVIYPCSRFMDSSLPGQPPAVAGLVPGKFWLSVGTIEPRKNQRRLVEAYAQYLRAGGPAMPLVLAGGKGWLMTDFQEAIDQLGVREHVIFTGYVSDDELIWLYRNCFANLYPSLFEGFGLPVLEGMQFGAPALCSDTSSLPEVCGDAAIQLPPMVTSAWSQAMLALAQAPQQRDRLIAAGQAQAARFAWSDSAAALLALYQEAAERPKRITP